MDNPLVRPRGRSGGRKPKNPADKARCLTVTLSGEAFRWVEARSTESGRTVQSEIAALVEAARRGTHG